MTAHRVPGTPRVGGAWRSNRGGRRWPTVALEVDEDALPFDKRLAACIVGAVYLDVLADPLQVVPLQVEGGDAFAVGEANGLTQGRIVADPPDGLYRVGEQHRVPDGPGLDSGEHQRGDPQLQKRLNLAEVGVTDDHVESAVPRRIGMGLIPGVDDRALQRGFETDLFFEEVGTLGDLEVDRGRPFSLPTLPEPVKT